MVQVTGQHIASQSALLGHPNALHFGTALRTFLLKTILNRFLRKNLLKVQVLYLLNKKAVYLRYTTFFGAGNRT